jgi:hypothetical protein
MTVRLTILLGEGWLGMGSVLSRSDGVSAPMLGGPLRGGSRVSWPVTLPLWEISSRGRRPVVDNRVGRVVRVTGRAYAAIRWQVVGVAG